MTLKISKVFFILLLFYMMWFQEVFFTINNMSSILGIGLIGLIIIHFFQTHKSFKEIKNYLPIELNLWLLFGLTSLLFGLFIAPDKILLINSLMRYFEFITLLYALYYISKHDKTIDFPVYVFLFIVLVSSITTIFWGYDYHKGRISMGPRNNPNSLGIMMVVGTAFLLYKLNVKKIFSILITIIMIGLFGYVTIITGSRKAFLALLLIFGFWISILILTQYRKLNIRKKILYTLSFIFSIFLFYYLLFPFLQDYVLWKRLVSLIKNGEDERVDMYKDAWRYFKENPLFGIGFNQYRVLSKYQTYSHTTYGEVLACTGLTGVVLYFSSYIMILIKYIKQIFNSSLSFVVSHQHKILLSLFGALLFLGVGVIHFYGTSSFLALGLLICFISLHRKPVDITTKEYKGKIGVIKKIIDRPRKIIMILGDKKIFNFLPDKIYLKLVFWGETGKRLNLNNPQTYNEKLQWLKLYDRKKIYAKYVDKLEVRKLIKDTIGQKYLIPLVAIYDTIEDIDWDNLPNKFVLKCTHGSKSNIICRDKIKLNKDLAIKKIKRWMNKNWYYFGREWPYKNVKPRNIVEKYLIDNITDYKILCFNGLPKLIQIHQNRESSEYTMDYYTTDWKKTDITKKGVKFSDVMIDKPDNLAEMLTIAKKLSQNTYFSRIDLYNVEDRIYFGEITLFPTSGFSPLSKEEDELLLGSWINLPL